MMKNNGNGKLTWILVGVLVSMAAWGLRETYGTLKDRIIAAEYVNNMQDTTLAKINTARAVDLQWKIAVAKNIEAIMDELRIPESRRAYAEPDTTRGRKKYE